MSISNIIGSIPFLGRQRMTISPSDAAVATAEAIASNQHHKKTDINSGFGQYPKSPSSGSIHINEVMQYIGWASTFIMILPLPVCLIDRKGFVHHTNTKFDELFNIPYDKARCPYIGRFFESATFRSHIEEVNSSEQPIVIIVKIKWIKDNIKNENASNVNELFEWTLSGCSSTDGFLLSGRAITPEMQQENNASESVVANSTEISAIEKYRRARAEQNENKVMVSCGTSTQDLQSSTKQTWSKFDRFVSDKNRISRKKSSSIMNDVTTQLFGNSENKRSVVVVAEESDLEVTDEKKSQKTSGTALVFLSAPTTDEETYRRVAASRIAE